MKVSKWFAPDNDRGPELFSRKKAETLTQAWEKTFEKWEKIIAGIYFHKRADSCGLCNLYNVSIIGRMDVKNAPLKRLPVNHTVEKLRMRSSPNFKELLSTEIKLVLAESELNFLRAVRSITDKKK